MAESLRATSRLPNASSTGAPVRDATESAEVEGLEAVETANVVRSCTEIGEDGAASKTVRTVTGPVNAHDLGVTLAHEHLLIDGSCYFRPLDGPGADEFADLVLTEDVVSSVRVASCSNRDNLLLDDVDLVVNELESFASLGGRTIVDMSNVGLGRDPSGLREISRRTGLRVVMGCGFYCEYAHPDYVAAASIEDLQGVIVDELARGVDGVQAGIIGEIGINGQERATLRYVGEMTADEEKVLRSAVRASHVTGAAVYIHQPNRGTATREIVRVLEEEEIDPRRVVLGHMSSIRDFDVHLAALERGYWIAYDNFGMGQLRNHLYDPITDDQRVDWTIEVVRRGLCGQLLISHDVWCKVQLRRFGGRGYDHILRNVAPALRERGLTDQEVTSLIIDNPSTLLAY
jgi:phosphotriesterase-related protein